MISGGIEGPCCSQGGTEKAQGEAEARQQQEQRARVDGFTLRLPPPVIRSPIASLRCANFDDPAVDRLVSVPSLGGSRPSPDDEPRIGSLRRRICPRNNSRGIGFGNSDYQRIIDTDRKDGDAAADIPEGGKHQRQPDSIRQEDTALSTHWSTSSAWKISTASRQQRHHTADWSH